MYLGAFIFIQFFFFFLANQCTDENVFKYLKRNTDYFLKNLIFDLKAACIKNKSANLS